MEKEKMVKEAVERMQILDLLDLPEESVIREFKEKGEVFVSRTMYMGEWVGVLYKLSDAERKLVEKIEREKKILVYHVIRNETSVGVMYAMLSVSGYKEDWRIERRGLENIETGEAHPMAYVWNAGNKKKGLTEGCGEWGSICIIKGEGGLCRI